MKLLSYAMLALLLVASGQSMAEQTPQPTTQNNRDAMIMPPAHD
ncbi:multiple antibiotic resistance regulatory protein MarB, partial [Citrobacter youngae]